MKHATRGLLLLAMLLAVAAPGLAVTGIFPPTAIQTTSDTTGITVRWTPSTYGGPYEYQLRLSTDRSRGSTKTVMVDWTVATTATGTVTPGQEVYFWLLTRNAGDTDGLDQGHYEMQGPYPATQPMATPAGVDATDGSSSVEVTITWGAVQGATEYRVYRSTSENGGRTAISDWFPTLTLSDRRQGRCLRLHNLPGGAHTPHIELHKQVFWPEGGQID